jgi:hypothetical protein
VLRERSLRGDRGRDRFAGAPESDEERVPLCVDLVAAELREGGPQEPLVVGAHLAVPLAEALDESRRAFDVGEEESDGPHRRAGPLVGRPRQLHHRRWVEGGVTPQDRPLELLQRPPRLESELLDEGVAALAIDVERLGLATRPVEREHQLSPEAFSKRLLSHEQLQLGDELGVPASPQISVDPVLETGQAKLLQACDLVPGEPLIGELGQRRPAPLCKRLVQLARLPQALSTRDVELVGLDPQQVAGCPGLQAVLAEQLPELRDVNLKRLMGRFRPLVLPKGVDQPLARDDLVRVQEQDGEEGPLFGAAESERLAGVTHLERPEDPELHQEVTVSWTRAPASAA